MKVTVNFICVPGESASFHTRISTPDGFDVGAWIQSLTPMAPRYDCAPLVQVRRTGQCFSHLSQGVMASTVLVDGDVLDEVPN